MRYLILILFLALVAACGGGGGAVAPAPDADFRALQDRVVAQGITDAAALPVTGAARYQGRVRLDLPLDGPVASYYGDLRLRVAFDGTGDPVTGQISDLRGQAGALAGALQISAGTLYRDAAPARDYQFTADLAGPLAQSGQSYDLTGRIAGDFHGHDAAAVAGVIYQGAIRQGDVVDLFDGHFAATRSGG